MEINAMTLYYVSEKYEANKIVYFELINNCLFCQCQPYDSEYINEIINTPIIIHATPCYPMNGPLTINIDLESPFTFKNDQTNHIFGGYAGKINIYDKTNQGNSFQQRQIIVPSFNDLPFIPIEHAIINGKSVIDVPMLNELIKGLFCIFNTRWFLSEQRSLYDPIDMNVLLEMLIESIETGYYSITELKERSLLLKMINNIRCCAPYMRVPLTLGLITEDKLLASCDQLKPALFDDSKLIVKEELIQSQNVFRSILDTIDSVSSNIDTWEMNQFDGLEYGLEHRIRFTDVIDAYNLYTIILGCSKKYRIAVLEHSNRHITGRKRLIASLNICVCALARCCTTKPNFECDDCYNLENTLVSFLKEKPVDGPIMSMEKEFKLIREGKATEKNINAIYNKIDRESIAYLAYIYRQWRFGNYLSYPIKINIESGDSILAADFTCVQKVIFNGNKFVSEKIMMFNPTLRYIGQRQNL